MSRKTQMDAEREEFHRIDRIKTMEINILVQENRRLTELLKKAQRTLSEFGNITDESRVGWCMSDIEKVLNEEGAK